MKPIPPLPRLRFEDVSDGYILRVTIANSKYRNIPFDITVSTDGNLLIETSDHKVTKDKKWHAIKIDVSQILEHILPIYYERFIKDENNSGK